MRILVVSAIVVLSIGTWTLAFRPQPLHGADASSDVRTPVLIAGPILRAAPRNNLDVPVTRRLVAEVERKTKLRKS